MTTSVPDTVWIPPSGQGEGENVSEDYIVDASGNFLVDTSGNFITSPETITTTVPKTVWSLTDD